MKLNKTHKQMLKDYLTKDNQTAVNALELITKLMDAKTTEERDKIYIQAVTGISLTPPPDVTPETLFGRK